MIFPGNFRKTDNTNQKISFTLITKIRLHFMKNVLFYVLNPVNINQLLTDYKTVNDSCYYHQSRWVKIISPIGFISHIDFNCDVYTVD